MMWHQARRTGPYCLLLPLTLAASSCCDEGVVLDPTPRFRSQTLELSHTNDSLTGSIPSIHVSYLGSKSAPDTIVLSYRYHPFRTDGHEVDTLIRVGGKSFFKKSDAAASPSNLQLRGSLYMASFDTTGEGVDVKDLGGAKHMSIVRSVTDTAEFISFMYDQQFDIGAVTMGRGYHLYDFGIP